jgi:hypothetical protein
LIASHDWIPVLAAKVNIGGKMNAKRAKHDTVFRMLRYIVRSVYFRLLNPSGEVRASLVALWELPIFFPQGIFDWAEVSVMKSMQDKGGRMKYVFVSLLLCISVMYGAWWPV